MKSRASAVMLNYWVYWPA